MKACPQCHMRYPPDAVQCFLDRSTLEELKDPLLGKTIAGRYVIDGPLGEGGMATVYRARHVLVDRPCAVKVMSAAFAADANVRERFRREAKSTQAIAHPNVIEIFDQGEMEDSTPYIVMELLDGQTLQAVIDAGAVGLTRAVPIMIQIARGIARAHDLGVVHRDLKPENIFVCGRDDSSDLVKILDFGIARSRTDSRLTSMGELFGTPQYMAPERISAGDTGPSVDLYALGVIFFEMVTGTLPFDASDPATYLIKHMRDPAPRARTLAPRIPEALDALVAQLMAKDPKARPVDAHRVEQDLLALSRALGLRPPPEPDADPASSRPPALTLPPAAHVEQWSQRIEVFQQMAQRAYGARAPDEAARTLAELKRVIQELTEVRVANAKEQRSLEEIDARGRDGRQRLGFAVDALGQDASKAREELRAAQLEIERVRQEAEAAAKRYVDAQRDLLSWEGRSAGREPYKQLAEAYRECAARVDAWRKERDRERIAQGVLEGKERGVSDLEYQITALRTALASHEQAIDRDRAAAQERAVGLQARAERIEPRVLELATRFCGPLRARADLAPLFRELETDRAAAS